MENEDSLQIAPVDEDVFWKNESHWHLLDGYTEDGDPKSKLRVNITFLQKKFEKVDFLKNFNFPKKSIF